MESGNAEILTGSSLQIHTAGAFHSSPHSAGSRRFELILSGEKANLYTESTILMHSSYFLYACSALITSANKAVYPARRSAF